MNKSYISKDDVQSILGLHYGEYMYKDLENPYFCFTMDDLIPLVVVHILILNLLLTVTATL